MNASLHEQLMALAEKLSAAGESAAPPCPDPVNAAMIRNWVQAIGDTDPSWESTAPPAMIQVWSMQGLGAVRAGSVADDPLGLLNDNGFTGVVATNCEQTYDRYLRLGEPLSSTMRFGDFTGPKKTGLGEGYFVTWYQTWYDADDQRVAEMLFRVLKFRPRKKAGAAEPKSGGRYPLPPAVGLDTRFFWDGVREGELRIQRCAECGALRHPPGPMCPVCHATEREHVVAAGRGQVYSYVVHHHPPVPGRTTPFVVAVVELDEGVRIVGNVIGCSPSEVRIGMPVELTFQRMDDEVTLAQWRPAGSPEPVAADPATEPATEPPTEPPTEPATMPELTIPLTPTFIIATALATRDFTPVHHDTELAQAQGSKGIFLNILTTMGLVQRYVTEQIPGAVLESIKVRLGAPAYAGDTLRLTGRVVEPADGDPPSAATVEVRGAVSLGDHVTATVRLAGGHSTGQDQKGGAA
ncbi:MAG: 3-oxo-4,17-pregnadiene-20-carboxyl-CoA hydratase alpha subunit [Streptosporangiaceae bacterium]|nr:3-oxo-4,17-pregnadiene-20-carboxyl-CoA hydratase alpha subunit [Streptosporangiaceae bacterium]